MDSAAEISELSLKKIEQLLDSKDPPLSRALFLRQVLRRVATVLPEAQPRPNYLRGFLDYIATLVGQPISFFYNHQNTRTENEEMETEEIEIEEEEIENELDKVRYEELMGIRNVGTMARKARLAEEEKMHQDRRLLQERGKRTLTPTHNLKLKKDPSAELIEGIINSTPLEKVPPEHFLRIPSN